MDKQQLKDAVGKLYLVCTEFFDVEGLSYMDNAVSVTKVHDLIDQLDEPEVLSQEWIDKSVVHVRGLGDFLEVIAVESLLVPKQGLPVIPKYVADWIKETKERGYPLAYAINCSKGELGKWLHECDTDIETEENQELFAEAWLGGYEVEEEQKYYVLTSSNKILLIKDNGEVRETYQVYSWVKKRDKEHYQLTEQEIKAIDERYWPFAVKVEELEE